MRLSRLRPYPLADGPKEKGDIVKAFRLLPPIKSRFYWIRVMIFTGITVLLSPLVFADDQPAQKDKNQIDEQIQIVADKLITNNTEKYAEF